MLMGSGRRDDLLRRPAGTLFIVILVIASVLAYFLPQLAPLEPEEDENQFFTIVFKATYQNKNSEGDVWNFTEDEAGVSLFMNSSWQTVCLANSSYEIERIETDTDGNPIAFMALPRPRLKSGENLSFEVAYRIILKPRSVPEISEGDSLTLNDMPEDLRALYCTSRGPWQVTDAGLRGLAYEVAGNETRVLTTVKRFIEWIRDHISRGTLDVPRYPIETFQGRVGDCDDQANLFVTLCRIVGIPAYLQAGCIYVSSKQSVNSYWDGCLISELTGIAWHGWALVYVPPWGWLPVDFTYVSLSDLLADPLNAIRMSAIIAYPTVQYANVTETDYIAASRDWRDFLIAHDFHIYEHDIMSEETAGEEVRHTALLLPPRIFVVFHVVPVAFLPSGSGTFKTHRISKT